MAHGYVPPPGPHGDISEFAGRLSAERVHMEEHVAKLEHTLTQVNRHLEQESVERKAAVTELMKKEALLRELETQFEVYKEEHRKLLASKLEDQREALNSEKDRMNQHFIKTGKELHSRNAEMGRLRAEVDKLNQENVVMKDWLDKGVEACKRVADENEKLKAELNETRSQVSAADAAAERKVLVMERERDRERGEKDAVSAAVQSTQERMIELQAACEESQRGLAEVTTQARRMRRRMATLRSVMDRYGQPAASVDPLAVLDADGADGDDPEIIGAPPSEVARDSMLRLHETLNAVQMSCRNHLQQKALQQGGPNPGFNPDAWQPPVSPGHGEPPPPPPGVPEAVHDELTQKYRRLDEEAEELRSKLIRKNVKLEELEDELDGLRRNRLSASEETEAAQRAARVAREEAERTREELDRLRLAKEQDTAASKQQIDMLSEELRKLSEDLEQFRDYGRQVEQENDELRRSIAAQEAASKQHNEENENNFRQLESQKEYVERESARQLEELQAKARWQEQQLGQEVEQQQQLTNQQRMLHQQEIEQLKLLLQQQATAHQQALDQQRELMAQQQQAYSQSAEQQHQQHQRQLADLHGQITNLQQQVHAANANASAAANLAAAANASQARPASTSRPPGDNHTRPTPNLSPHGTPARPPEDAPPPSNQPSGPAVVVVHAPQPTQPSESGRRTLWGADPDDYGHASPAHQKLTCTLCAAEGFVPGLPCRNCGFSVGQFTRLRAGSGGAGLSRADTAVNSAATSPRRWY
eukprot:Hpha_TRINITY_DN15202_c0_g4::TRINITY_DN15202_c0_g4_i1::g.66952::m.66952